MDRRVRRLADIVAANVVGYSRIIEAREGSTLAALKDVRIACRSRGRTHLRQSPRMRPAAEDVPRLEED
jgi:hypothetical protein